MRRLCYGFSVPRDGMVFDFFSFTNSTIALARRTMNIKSSSFAHWERWIKLSGFGNSVFLSTKTWWLLFVILTWFSPDLLSSVVTPVVHSYKKMIRSFPDVSTDRQMNWFRVTNYLGWHSDLCELLWSLTFLVVPCYCLPINGICSSSPPPQFVIWSFMFVSTVTSSWVPNTWGRLIDTHESASDSRGRYHVQSLENKIWFAQYMFVWSLAKKNQIPGTISSSTALGMISWPTKKKHSLRTKQGTTRVNTNGLHPQHNS